MVVHLSVDFGCDKALAVMDCGEDKFMPGGVGVKVCLLPMSTVGFSTQPAGGLLQVDLGTGP